MEVVSLELELEEEEEEGFEAYNPSLPPWKKKELDLGMKTPLEYSCTDATAHLGNSKTRGNSTSRRRNFRSGGRRRGEQTLIFFIFLSFSTNFFSPSPFEGLI